MFFRSLMRRWVGKVQPGQRIAQAARRFQPRLEALEDRYVLSTLTVLNTNDSGAGSLRNAIATAQNGDTITFDRSLQGQSISLTSGELSINKNLDIEGPGGAKTAGVSVGGFQNGARVFEIAPGANVTLANLTLWDGNSDHGGDIANAGSLTLRGCSIVAGLAVGGSAGASARGGDIYSSGNLTLDNCDVEYGVAMGGPGGAGMGGGIYLAGGTVLINNSRIGDISGHAGNLAQGFGTGPGQGGGLYVAGGGAQGGKQHCGLQRGHHGRP